jgi:hypothetical protein
VESSYFIGTDDPNGCDTLGQDFDTDFYMSNPDVIICGTTQSRKMMFETQDPSLSGTRYSNDCLPRPVPFLRLSRSIVTQNSGGSSASEYSVFFLERIKLSD